MNWQNKLYNFVMIRKFKVMFVLTNIDENILRNALKSQIKDFEDAVIEVSSLQNDVDCIVSRNKEDFAKSKILCLEPADFLARINLNPA